MTRWGILGSMTARSLVSTVRPLVRVTGEIVPRAEGLPAGLITLQPCLTPGGDES